MPRNVDSTMSAHLTDGVIHPAFFGSFQFRSGVTNAWTGVGDFTWNGLTFRGVGDFGEISPVTEGTEVQADGITVQLANVPFPDAAPTAPVVASPYQNTVLGNRTTPTSSVTLSVNQGDLLLLLAYADCYGVQPPVAPTISADSQGNSWTTDKINLAYYIGGTGFGYLLAHTTAAATGDLTVTTSVPTGCYTGALLVRTTASGIDDTDLEGGSIGARSLSLSATTSAPNEYAMVLSIGGNWAANPGTLLYSYGDASTACTGEVWDFSTSEGTVDCTVSGDAHNFPGAAMVILQNPPGTPLVEIQNDIQLGAPAKIWFGLLDGSGALIGTPYLIFSGMVDQPTIDVDTQTMTVTLALENRLTNLQRPSGRRYTSADQRLFYPDDTGFQWVEPLNDLALRWGS